MTVGGAYNQPMPNIPPTHIPIRPDVVSGNFMKIAMLNPYSSTWTIKVKSLNENREGLARKHQ